MPRRTDLRSILILGSGPIAIDQAAEFDYSGTPAVRVLRKGGVQRDPGQQPPATTRTTTDELRLSSCA